MADNRVEPERGKPEIKWTLGSSSCIGVMGRGGVSKIRCPHELDSTLSPTFVLGESAHPRLALRPSALILLEIIKSVHFPP